MEAMKKITDGKALSIGFHFCRNLRLPLLVNPLSQLLGFAFDINRHILGIHHVWTNNSNPMIPIHILNIAALKKDFY